MTPRRISATLISMKILKLLFSKIFVSALVLFLQLTLVLSVLLFFESYFVWFQIFNAILGILVFLGIIGKKEPPEFKLPWIFIVLVVPFFGIIIYCMFANSRMPMRQFKGMIDITCRCKKYSELSKDENDKIKAELGGCYGLENYLRKNSFSRGHLNNRVTYFKSGEDFYADLLAELAGAESFIFMEYFIIDHGFMWDGIHEILAAKAAAGVEVRVMYDDIGSAGLLKSSFRRKLKKEGIRCVRFNPFRPVISGIHNNRDHRKITVIDGRTGYTGGINIADEYINAVKRFGHWKDTAVKIEGSAVANLTAMFLQMFDCSDEQPRDYDRYFVTAPEEFPDPGYVNPFGDGPKPFYTELVGANNYINIINAATDYVYITTPYLIPDYNTISALRNAAMRGVDVRIITPAVPDKKIIFNMTRSNYRQLWTAGIKIYEYTPGFIHSKLMLADGKIACVGTINLDYRSLVHHYECGAVLYGAPCLADIRADLDETIAASREITEGNFRMGFFSSVLNAVLNLFSPML